MMPSEALRQSMRDSLFAEIAGFFATEDEGRSIASKMEENCFHKAQTQEEYLSSFQKHLLQLKNLKKEAAQNQKSTSSVEPQPQAATPSHAAPTPLHAGPAQQMQPRVMPVSSSAVAGAVQAVPINENQNRNNEILEYLTQCQKKISPAFLESIVDFRQKLFFEQLVLEIHSVRQALEKGVSATHADLVPRIKVIVEKVRAINKSQAQHSQNVAAASRHAQIQAAMGAAAHASSRPIPVAQAVASPMEQVQPVTTPAAGAKRKRSKPAASRAKQPSRSSSSASLGKAAAGADGTISRSNSLDGLQTAFDPKQVSPGIKGFFDHLAKFDKKSAQAMLRLSSQRIGTMLTYIETREGFEAAQAIRDSHINAAAKQAQKPSSPPNPLPVSDEPEATAATPAPEAPAADTTTRVPASSALLTDPLTDGITGRLVAESVADDSSVPVIADRGVPYQKELDQIRSSGLFFIIPIDRRHPSWRMIRFDLLAMSVPSLLVGIRNDYNEQEPVADRIQYRVQKGTSTMADENIRQIDALLRRCMGQRRPILFDLICTWHLALKHVFSIDTDQQQQAQQATTDS
ncbi:unnamed protein product (mitochondrion) [Plasmodiophora brassicae]|uniref:Mediator of RNA polymerase II transcription subunit 15 n=1 Tax=Plasmodiophora brassicae TaxID=37360 RepID=A0A0G4IQ49_PLABS|nr:hypothetical protein PBRA_000682 [Plasmodiophora brassicae]SPQ97647.1 unnamed protein product [Plasmodiophora brassicae]